MGIGRFGTVAVVLAAVLGIASVCSASTPHKPRAFSKSAYIKAGDKICEQGRERENAIYQKHFGGLAKGQQPDAAALASFVEEVAPVLRHELAALRALRAPKSDAKTVKRIWDAAEAAIQKDTEDPTQLLSGNRPIAKAKRLMRVDGFKVCGISRPAAGRDG
jgi:hypothetical protein